MVHRALEDLHRAGARQVKQRLYVGIDPSFTATGIVVLDESSLVLNAVSIKLPADGQSNLDRAIAITNGVQAAVEDTAPGAEVTMAGIENYSLGSKYQVAMIVTLGTTLRLRMRALNWPYVEPGPTQVKVYALMTPKKGKGNKMVYGKTKPFKEVAEHWGFHHKSGDVIDAYVLAQVARAAGGAQLLGHLHERQLDVLAKLKKCS